MVEIAGTDFDIGPEHPHGSNIYTKKRDRKLIGSPTRARLLGEVESKYAEWRAACEAVTYVASQRSAYATALTDLFNSYREFLDEERFDVFDSRGNLQSSALEEFCFYLFRPLVDAYGAEIALGHRNVFVGLFFTADNFSAFAEMPNPQYRGGNVDFVIGKRVTNRLSTDKQSHERDIYVPAVAIECKTYIDKTMWTGAENLAGRIKRGFPRCLYIVLAELLKLDLREIDVYGSDVDRVFVLRRTRNVDRSVRRASGAKLATIHQPAVLELLDSVVAHLTEDWVSPEEWTASGVLK
ncbi:MAG TPA: Bpu10I family restriction endonuclease [Rhodothermales bacterium]